MGIVGLVKVKLLKLILIIAVSGGEGGIRTLGPPVRAHEDNPI